MCPLSYRVRGSIFVLNCMNNLLLVGLSLPLSLSLSLSLSCTDPEIFVREGPTLTTFFFLLLFLFVFVFVFFLVDEGGPSTTVSGSTSVRQPNGVLLASR